jgi:hypothetical protein
LGIIGWLLGPFILFIASSISSLANLHMVLLELQNYTLSAVRTVNLLEVIVHLDADGIHQRRIYFWWSPLTTKLLLVYKLPLSLFLFWLYLLTGSLAEVAQDITHCITGPSSHTPGLLSLRYLIVFFRLVGVVTLSEHVVE